MIFDGITSDDMGVYINRYIPLLPQRRERSVKITNVDGERDLGDGAYECRDIIVECAMINTDPEAMMIQRDAVAKWLSHRSELIFSDRPDRKWKGRILDKVEFEDQSVTGEFKLTFKCDPASYGDEYADSAKSMTPVSVPINYPGTYKACNKIIIANTGTQPVSDFVISYINKKR